MLRTSAPIVGLNRSKLMVFMRGYVGRRSTPSLGTMAVKEGPVPPFPDGADPDEYDRLRRRVLWKMPSGLYVVGATDGGERRNGMTLNWATQVSFEPKWLGVGDRARRVHPRVDRGIAACSPCASSIGRTGRSSASSPSPSRSTSRRKTLNDFPYIDGPATGAPVLAQSVAYVECEVRQPVEVGNHTLFLGEVVNAAFLKDEDTEVLRMEDTRMNYGG